MSTSRFRTALALAIVLAFSLSVPFDALARGGGHSGSYSAHSSSSYSSSGSHTTNSHSSIECASCPRDSRGKIKRDPKCRLRVQADPSQASRL